MKKTGLSFTSILILAVVMTLLKYFENDHAYEDYKREALMRQVVEQTPIQPVEKIVFSSPQTKPFKPLKPPKQHDMEHPINNLEKPK